MRGNGVGAAAIKRKLGVKSKIMGKGCFAIVYPKDEETVIKITSDPVHYRFIAEMPDNKHFPIIKALHGSVGYIDDEEVFAYEAERLSEIDKSDRDFTSFHKSLSKADSVLEGWNQQYKAKKIKALRIAADDADEEFSFALQHIATFAENRDVWLDMHAGNFMRRSDGTLVINDPVVVW